MRAAMVSRLTISSSVAGRFGPYGGRYVPETLMVPLLELERAYQQATTDPAFQAKFQNLLKNFAGRPTPLQFADRLTAHLGGPRSISNAKIFCTPGLTRSTMPSGRACWRCK